METEAEVLGYDEVLAYLEDIAKSGSFLGLESMRNLMRELGNVQEKLRFIHVAGTNGKGSVCAMIATILRQAGIREGKYTSPAVFGRMEQYQVAGKDISIPEFVSVVSEVREACERLVAGGKAQPTLFEVETAAAFLYFHRQKCQVVVLETGMGGATDATNIIRRPLVSVITSISMDHMKFLGDDLRQIARMKAGIIKEGCPVVAVKPNQDEVRRIIETECRRKHAALTYSEAKRVGEVHYCREGNEMRLCFSYPPGSMDEAALSMLGGYQIENAACAIETAKVLQDAGLGITEKDVREGLGQARWEGRFSVLCQNPLFVMDGAHNAGAAEKLWETLKRGFTNRRIIYIIGVLADKAHEEMLRIMLPLASLVYTVTPNHPRAMDGQALAAEAGRYHKHVSCCPTVRQAVEEAFSVAGGEDMVLAFGSLSYLRELREAVREQNGKKLP